MTLFFKPHEIEIYRHRRKTGTDRYAMSATFTVYPADIQPASQQRIDMIGGRFGTTYTGFIDATVSAKEGDQVEVIGTGKRYSVKGVQVWQGAGLLDYTELVLVSQDGN